MRQSELMATLLPSLELDLSSQPPAKLSELFKAPVEQVALEIGFGGAEHMIAQARANPNTGFIGCEPFEDGVAKALSAIDQHHLTNVRLF
ncbi:MAG: tRNA (guanosine(46)-N7)-methyltransferase TrmB, partial [Pseudomonadota bacterium]